MPNNVLFLKFEDDNSDLRDGQETWSGSPQGHKELTRLGDWTTTIKG